MCLLEKLEAMVMGGHGDTMVPLPRFTKFTGKPLLDLVKEGKISKDKLESINQRTRDGGAEIVKYLEKRFSILCTSSVRCWNGRSILKR